MDWDQMDADYHHQYEIDNGYNDKDPYKTTTTVTILMITFIITTLIITMINIIAITVMVICVNWYWLWQ